MRPVVRAIVGTGLLVGALCTSTAIGAARSGRPVPDRRWMLACTTWEPG